MPVYCSIAVFSKRVCLFNVHHAFVLLVIQDFLKLGLSLDKEFDEDSFDHGKDPGDLLIEGKVELVASISDNEERLGVVCDM